MHKISAILAVFLGTLLLSSVAQAAEYQFSLPIGERDGRAFLWIPPSCQHVRGLLLASQVILEKQVCDDPLIRQACARSDMGIVLLSRRPDNLFPDRRNLTYDQRVSEVRSLAAQDKVAIDIQKPSAAPASPGTDSADGGLQQILNDLAAESGYSEIATAPLLTLGHSGGAIFAWHVAYAYPERALGVIGLHSAVILPPTWAPKATPSGFPALCISGEYESWSGPAIPLDNHWRWLRGGILDMRGHWDAQAFEIVQPGGTHFNWDPPLARFTAMFIEKVAQYRLPPAGSASVALKTLPMDSGWLTDIRLLSPSRFPPTPYAKFRDDPSLAFWHMDGELARAVENYGKPYGGKTDQRVTFVVDGKPVPASWIEDVPFEPLADGMTVKVSAAFLDRTPEGVAGAGRPLGHAKGPIKFRLIGGWGGGGEQVGPDTFRIHYSNFGVNDNMMIMAYQQGDATYKYAEQPCQIKFPAKNTQGKPQTITFPKIDAITARAVSTIPLQATSDSGLPVSYYVQSGPAEVKNNTLVLAPIPPKAAYPVKLTVVAYQWGRPITPLVQSAMPVQQTILIEKP